ncbi:Ulp1 protease family, catalytic domain protein [Oesophagostomum dentatum]|uniref:Ulp1 protease family, catalytic domain protein n=1 Tax=Oesophagostomum dentatum TaxID=61180 RepID=A0A0B1SI18_OESDE|nr:Ulp1 protease family, catalytic domain protein [Oesophagostomum dentatum]
MCSSSHGDKDSKVLSYGDVVLYESDVNTLLPGVWLNDNILSFVCEFLMENSSREVKEQVAIVSAASCELIRYAGDASIIREIFTSLNFFDKEKILFVLNDREDPRVVGGFHWSLLVLDRRAAHFHYYDSTRPAKTAVAKQVVGIVSEFLDNKDIKFTIEDCPQQRNSFDCGMYVIEFIRHVLKVCSYAVYTKNTYRIFWNCPVYVRGLLS